MTADLSADLALAQQLADAARSVTMPRFRGTFASRNKADGSLVTEVDEAVEDAIRAIVARERPRDAFLGEERGETGSGPRRWIVDAIDGTLSFAAGTTGWGTLIALEIDGRVAVGVCEMSPIGKRYWASRGGGAYVSRGGAPSVRLEVSGTAAARCSALLCAAGHVGTDRGCARDVECAPRGHAAVRGGRASGARDRGGSRGSLRVLHGRPVGSGGAVARRRRGRRPLHGPSGRRAGWRPAPYSRTAGCTMRLSSCCRRAGSAEPPTPLEAR